ncbi:MAG: DivIVA domain-containing protein [Clostridia bacterium]|nr:DivIVA domain-containing protein [Clostridia bacterium]
MGRNKSMLTPENIKEKSFHTTGRGSYRADDVDNFLNEVTASYEQMFNQNADLVKKISLLAKKIEEYRADEESLKMALLNAQKLADKIVAEARETAERENAEINEETARLHEVAEKVAKEAEENAKAEAEKIVADAKAEAEAILNDANAQAKDILGNINRKVTHESLVYEMIQKEASEFKSKLVAMYKEHINLINQLPEFVENKLEEEVIEEKVEEVDDEPVVIEEAPVVVDMDEETTEEVVEESVEEEIEETVEEIVEESIAEVEETEEVEMVEEVVEEPVVKKPFKLDLSKIDFADDDDFVTEPEAPAIIEEVVEDATEDDDEEPKSISFKNFFKKK